MTLGMIWTIILRFAIQDISVEGKRRGEKSGYIETQWRVNWACKLEFERGFMKLNSHCRDWMKVLQTGSSQLSIWRGGSWPWCLSPGGGATLEEMWLCSEQKSLFQMNTFLSFFIAYYTNTFTSGTEFCRFTAETLIFRCKTWLIEIQVCSLFFLPPSFLPCTRAPMLGATTEGGNLSSYIHCAPKYFWWIQHCWKRWNWPA